MAQTRLPGAEDTDQDTDSRSEQPPDHVTGEHHTWFPRELRDLDFSHAEMAAWRRELKKEDPDRRWIRIR